MTHIRGMMMALAALVAVALLAAACAGGGGDGTPPADETPAGGETVTAGETPAADGGSAGELGDLAALAEVAAEGVAAKVTYTFRTETAGEITEGEWVLAQRPPDFRVEFAGTNGDTLRTIVISAEGGSYICFSGDGQQSCIATGQEETQAQTAPLDPLFSIPEDLVSDVQDVALVDKSERTIAGEAATCFAISSSIIGLGEGEVCFAGDGLLLFLRGQSNGDSFTFEATSVERNVTDADFEPPFEVVDLSDFGNFENLPDASP